MHPSFSIQRWNLLRTLLQIIWYISTLIHIYFNSGFFFRFEPVKMIFQYTTQKSLVLLGRHRPLHLNSKRKGYYFCHTLYNIILCRSIFISVLKNRNDKYLPLDPNTNTIKLLPLHSIIMKKKINKLKSVWRFANPPSQLNRIFK